MRGDDKDAVTSSLAWLKSHFDDTGRETRLPVKTVTYLKGPKRFVFKGPAACRHHFNKAFLIIFSNTSYGSGMIGVISLLLFGCFTVNIVKHAVLDTVLTCSSI